MRITIPNNDHGYVTMKDSDTCRWARAALDGIRALTLAESKQRYLIYQTDRQFFLRYFGWTGLVPDEKPFTTFHGERPISEQYHQARRTFTRLLKVGTTSLKHHPGAELLVPLSDYQSMMHYANKA